MKRWKLSKLLHLLVKDYQKDYLKLKRETDIKYPDWRNGIGDKNDIYFTMSASKYYKTIQKVLEYVRKGEYYTYIEPEIDEMNDMFGIYDPIKVIVYGRNTWNKQEKHLFEITISDEELKKYSNIIERELKLKRILK